MHASQNTSPDAGFSIIPNWMVRSDIFESVYEMAVYMVLLNRADADGSSFPSLALIAHDARASKTTVRAALARLVELGLVEISGRIDHANNDAQTSNLYHVNVWTPPSSRRTPVVQQADPPGPSGGPEVLPIEVLPREGRARESEDGRERPPPKNESMTDRPSPDGDEPSPYCVRHPEGTDGAPCGACGEARRSRERWDKRHEKQRSADKAAGQNFAEFLKSQPDCPHGIAGGDQNRPSSGTPTCVGCRQAAKSGLYASPPERTLPDCPHGMPGGDWLTTTAGTVRCSYCRAEGRQLTSPPMPDQSEPHTSRDGYKTATDALRSAKDAREAKADG